MMDGECYLYDQVLIGRKQTCGKELFESTMNNQKEYNPIDEQRALKILRYAFEYYLGWTPEQIRANIDEEILKKMKLDGIVRQRIQFPMELDPMQNLQYLVHRMYPERYTYNARQAIEEYYDRVLSGDVKRFKKGFFTSKDGTERAQICFRRMLQMIGPFEKVEQIYDLFASTEGNRVLAKYKLHSAGRDLYPFPIDFLHYSLPEQERNELYYQMTRFYITNTIQKKQMRRDGTFKA